MIYKISLKITEVIIKDIMILNIDKLDRKNDLRWKVKYAQTNIMEANAHKKSVPTKSPNIISIIVEEITKILIFPLSLSS